MGLIIMPVVIFWLVSYFFSWRIGYALFSEKPFFPYIVMVVIIAIVVALAYVWTGLHQFKHRDKVWVFEIAWFFLSNQYAFMLFILAIVAYFFAGNLIEGDLLKSVIFVVAFAIPLGSLIGCFSSDAFIQKHKISTTY